MSLDNLKQNNIEWANSKVAQDPNFFKDSAKGQQPEYLWIGCADSRVPANNVIGLEPGELFVHRNIANVVVHTDLNCMSVLQYAVDVLKVKHVIVCGHYGCGGVKASMENNQVGLIDSWLTNLKDVYYSFEKELSVLDSDKKFEMMCELNVKAQVLNVAKTKIVQNAWLRGQELSVHGWIYGLENGLIKDLNTTHSNVEDLPAIYQLNGA